MTVNTAIDAFKTTVCNNNTYGYLDWYGFFTIDCSSNKFLYIFEVNI